MASSWRLENIQKLREDAGIQDDELRTQVEKLCVGDVVHVTVLDTASAGSGGVVDVKILSIRGQRYCGEVVNAPAASGWRRELLNQQIVFGDAHIHSVPTHSQLHK